MHVDVILHTTRDSMRNMNMKEELRKGEHV